MAGFSVTPSMVQNDPKLEEYIVRRIVQANHEVMNKQDFQLQEGTGVKVYNPESLSLKDLIEDCLK